MKTPLCKVPHKRTGADSPCCEELTSEKRCPPLLFLCLGQPGALPAVTGVCLTLLCPVCRTLHFRIHTAVRSLHVLHSGRTCPQHAREPCQSRDGTFVVACPRLVSVQPVVVSRLWALAVEVGLCKTRGRCSLLLHRSSQLGEGHHALPEPPFAEDSVVWSLWDGCAEQRTSAPAMGTTGPSAWSCLRHDNS